MCSLPCGMVLLKEVDHEHPGILIICQSSDILPMEVDAVEGKKHLRDGESLDQKYCKAPRTQPSILSEAALVEVLVGLSPNFV